MHACLGNGIRRNVGGVWSGELKGNGLRRRGVPMVVFSASEGGGPDMEAQKKQTSTGLVEAATRYALARQEELAAQLRRDVWMLEVQLKEEETNQQWASFVKGLEGDVEEVFPGGTPWEPDEEALDEMSMLANEA